MGESLETINVNIHSLRLVQGYVKRPVVEAKRWIEHLQFKWKTEWRDHRFDLRRDVGEKVIDQLAFLELKMPIVEKRGDIYIVLNGAHTAYSYWERKFEEIQAQLTLVETAGSRRFYTFEEIRVEEE